MAPESLVVSDKELKVNPPFPDLGLRGPVIIWISCVTLANGI